MKDILCLLENTTQKSLKRFIFTFISFYGIEVGWILMNSTENGFYNSLLLWSLTLFILITYLNYARIKALMKDGAYRRILLLPVRRSNFVLSQVLFTLALYSLFFVLQAFLWIIWQQGNKSEIIMYVNQFSLKTISYGMEVYGLPYSFSSMCLFYLNLLSLAIVFTFLSVAFSMKERIGTAVLILFLFPFEFLFVQHVSSLLAYLLFYTITLYSLYCFNKLLGVQRRKGS